MDKYQNELMPVIEKLVNEFGIDSVIDFLGGLCEKADFEKMKREMSEFDLVDERDF